MAQFKSIIVGLLAIATVLAFVMGETIEGAAILVVILLNAVTGFLTEWKARQALTALRAQAASRRRWCATRDAFRSRPSISYRAISSCSRPAHASPPTGGSSRRFVSA